MMALNKILIAIIPLILSVIISIVLLKVSAEDSNYSGKYSKNLKLNNNTAIYNNNTTNGLQYNNSKPLLKVVASFFPIYEFVKAVGGDRIQASVLIPIGSEPHNFDPTIQQISNAQNADMVVYNGAGMESAWINKINPKFIVDTSQGLNLLLSGNKEATLGSDPHIWLDPILVEHQINIIRDSLIKIDPNDASYYKINAQKFIAQLNSLDSYIKSGLSNCNKKDFISFHNAFAYFAQRYGLVQHSIEGLSPEGEILPQKIQEIIQLANKLGINTIYSEDLVDPRGAQIIADEILNGKVLILSPIEGIKPTEQQAGIGYLDKMKQDLTNLEVGLQCKNNQNKTTIS
jgi:zinc transport system substrate-binding protein